MTKEIPKVKRCHKCNKEVGLGVCEWFVTHILEEGEEYECWECWCDRNQRELEQERFCRRILQDILMYGGRK